MRVLLSIKPEFAEMIFAGTKKFEFRRTVFKNPDVRTVVVYASFPVQKVIGEFEIEKIINDKVKSLWEQTKKYAGIDETFFFSYFSDKEDGYAIKIKKAKKYKKALCLRKDFNTTPPQSFMYLDAVTAQKS
jgi:predicted transcriptional regulator